MIGLHTGARVNEVAQLKTTDIIKKEGMWCMAIRKTADEGVLRQWAAREQAKSQKCIQ